MNGAAAAGLAVAIPDVFAPLGYLAAAVGLLGVSRSVADRTPRLAALGTGLSLVGIAGWAVVAAATFASALLAPLAAVSLVPLPVQLAVLVSMVLGYAVVGSASRRAGGHSRAASASLVVPAVLFVVLFGSALATDVDPALGAALIGAGQTVAHLAIGVTLDTQPVADDVAVGAGDSVTG